MVSQKQILCLPSSVCRKSPARPWGLETFTNTQNHRKHLEENAPSLSNSLLPSSAPYRQWILDQRAWERSKVSERKAQMTLRWISTKWSRLSQKITTPKRAFSRDIEDQSVSAISATGWEDGTWDFKFILFDLTDILCEKGRFLKQFYCNISGKKKIILHA